MEYESPSRHTSVPRMPTRPTTPIDNTEKLSRMPYLTPSMLGLPMTNYAPRDSTQHVSTAAIEGDSSYPASAMVGVPSHETLNQQCRTPRYRRNTRHRSNTVAPTWARGPT